jgi:hypothetical protein
MISLVTFKIQILAFVLTALDALIFTRQTDLFVRVIPIVLLANILARDAFASVGLAISDCQREKAQKFYPWPIVAWAPLRVSK